MTTKPSRADLVRQRRSSGQRPTPAPKPASRSARTSVPASSSKRARPLAALFLPVEPHRTRRNQFSTEASRLRLAQTARPRPAQASRHGSTQASARGQHYDIAFSLGNTGVRAPTFSLPEFGPRWVSGALTLLLVFLLFTMWNASAFTVQAAEVTGNVRISGADISSMLGVVGQPVFKAVPTVLETNLRNAYPDLAFVKAHVAFPNRVSVQVVERVPILAWYQNGVVTWIDADGVAFLPRGEAQGLIQVAANGTPPRVDGTDKLPIYEQKFIDPAMVGAMKELYPYLPANAPMIYDPQYGMGWQDSHGWFVYFGQTATDIPKKLLAYQAISATFTSQGIQPSLVSVEYPDAPFYK